MIERDNAQIDVDLVMSKIRQEIAARRRHDDQSNNRSISLEQISAMSKQFDSNLELIKEHAYIASRVPLFPHYPKVLRPIAKLIAKVIIFISSFITDIQRQFNLSLIQYCQCITNELKNFEFKLQDQAAQINNFTSQQQANNPVNRNFTINNEQMGAMQLEQTVMQLKQELKEQQQQIIILQSQIGQLNHAHLDMQNS